MEDFEPVKILMVLYGVINLKLLLANGPYATLLVFSCHVISKCWKSQPMEIFEH